MLKCKRNENKGILNRIYLNLNNVFNSDFYTSNKTLTEDRLCRFKNKVKES